MKTKNFIRNAYKQLKYLHTYNVKKTICYVFIKEITCLCYFKHSLKKHIKHKEHKFFYVYYEIWELLLFGHFFASSVFHF
ncbi:MAG: hypothetical protein BZ136_07685 [Methanosphaera sp. rholeuAM74]|nr:MAG: hypothetical protein BZ136_07685 [Methanosphaera sp. rholeuAM74]